MTKIEQDPNHSNRVLTLEIRSTKVAYVVFEGKTKLLDWGIVHKTHLQSTVGRRLAGLYRLFKPVTILVSHNQRHNSICMRTIQMVRNSAQEVNISVVFISRKSVLVHFDQSKRINKYSRAKIIADQFPELLSRLPHERKSWQSEPTKVLIFDAAAIGVAYFSESQHN
jgi:hypothetical protein